MPFQPGNTYGIKGRPKKGQATADLLRAIGDMPYAGGRKDITHRQRAAQVIWEQACQGNLQALQWIVERTEGKVPDVSKANDRLRVEIVYGQDAPEGGSDDGDE